MSVTNTLYRIVLCAFYAALLSSCTVYRAPSGWLPERSNVGREPYGGWLYVRFLDGGKEQVGEGEFIGFSDTTLLLLNTNGLVRVPKGNKNISYASLKINDDNRGGYALWAIAGMIAAPFVNGWYSIFTLPLWIIGGPIAASAEYYSGAFITDYPGAIWWRSIAPYSRFPQGIPENLEVSGLKPKTKTPSNLWKK